MAKLQLNPVTGDLDLVGGGGGGDTAIHMGTALMHYGSGATQTNTSGSGVVDVFSNRYVRISTGSTANSYSSIYEDPAGGFSGNKWDMWQYDTYTSIKYVITAMDVGTEVIVGIGNGFWSSGSFSPFRFSGVRIVFTGSSTADFICMTGNGSSSTTDTTAMNLSTSFYDAGIITIDRRRNSEVNFYLNGDLISTITTTIPTSGMFQVDSFYAAVGNASVASNLAMNVYNAVTDFYVAS